MSENETSRRLFIVSAIGAAVVATITLLYAGYFELAAILVPVSMQIAFILRFSNRFRQVWSDAHLRDQALKLSITTAAAVLTIVVFGDLCISGARATYGPGLDAAAYSGGICLPFAIAGYVVLTIASGLLARLLSAK